MFFLQGIVFILKCDIHGSWMQKWKVLSVNVGVGSLQDIIGLNLFVVEVTYGILCISRFSINILCSGTFTLNHIQNCFTSQYSKNML